MKVKFNKYERVAGIFVVTALVGSLFAIVAVAARKGWFSSKLEYHTSLNSADGLHEGTEVQVAGIRAGSVTEINLLAAEKIEVHFTILEKFKHLIRKDSRAQVVRPFVIGEKVIDVSVGSEDSEILDNKSHIIAKQAYDVMDLVSGRKLGPLLASVEGLLTNMNVLAEAFSDSSRSKAFVSMFDQLEPMVTNVNKMALGMTDISSTLLKQKRLESLVPQLITLTHELAKMSKETPEMYRQIPKLVDNLNVLTQEFRKITPAISAVAPKLPAASLRAVELLDEAVVLLKAMQRSFILSGKVKDVRKEEAAKEQLAPPADREPASP